MKLLEDARDDAGRPLVVAALDQRDQLLAAGVLEEIAVGTASLGLSTGFDGRDFSYWIAREIEAGSEIPASMQSITIPARRYAVFTAAGAFPQSVWKTVDFIYKDWLTRPGNRRADGPDFEWYDSRYDVATGSGEVDLYVPIE